MIQTPLCIAPSLPSLFRNEMPSFKCPRQVSKTTSTWAMHIEVLGPRPFMISQFFCWLVSLQLKIVFRICWFSREMRCVVDSMIIWSELFRRAPIQAQLRQKRRVDCQTTAAVGDTQPPEIPIEKLMAW